MAAHPHAALMAEYARDAAETDVPQNRWQYRNKKDVWVTCSVPPTWSPRIEYRKKRDLIRVGKLEFPRPYLLRPEVGIRYYTPDLQGQGGTWNIPYEWQGSTSDTNRLDLGLVHLSAAAATAHTMALLSVTHGKPNHVQSPDPVPVQDGQ